MSLITNNTANKLKCDDGATVKTLIFYGSSLDITLGADTLMDFPLSSFVEVVNKYQYDDFVLAAGQTIDINPPSYVTSATGEIKFICILVSYPTDISSVTIPSTDKFIQFEYPSSGQIMNIGKIMILSGAEGNAYDLVASPGGMRLINPHAFDVAIKMLIVN